MKETVTYKDIRGNKEINQLIEKGNEILGVLGYTEHSKKHAARVAETAAGILKDLGYGSHEMELARIAGYMHDIGNSINRHDHAHSGAILAYQILKDLGMPLRDIVTITGAIGHHDEATGTAIDAVSYTHLDVYKRQNVDFPAPFPPVIKVRLPDSTDRLTLFNTMRSP